MADGFRSAVSKVAEFMLRQGMEIAPEPTIPSAKVRMQRIALLAEETGELCKAISAGNLVEIADGTGDLIFVAINTLLQHGIDPLEVLHIICDSNLTKTKLNASDLKGGKGPGYESPTEKLKRLIELQYPPQVPTGLENNKEGESI